MSKLKTLSDFMWYGGFGLTMVSMTVHGTVGWVMMGVGFAVQIGGLFVLMGRA